MLEGGRRRGQFRRVSSAKLDEDFAVTVHPWSPMFGRMEMGTTVDLADLVLITSFDKGFEGALVPGSICLSGRWDHVVTGLITMCAKK